MSVELNAAPSGTVPAGYSYAATVAWFLAGGVVTALFSGSLAVLAKNATLFEVLAVGMIVPTFTWAVQLIASGFLLAEPKRRLYGGDLGRICLLGSFALWPAAAVNLLLSEPPLWLSAVNVIASVLVMAVDLFRRAKSHDIPLSWPVSWCLTITLNMSLFATFSWHWW